MDGVEEEKGAHSLIQVLAAPAEVVQLRAFPQQFLQREASAGPLQRLVAERRLCRRDDANEIWHSTWKFRTAHRPNRWLLNRASVWALISPLPWLFSGNPLSPGVSGSTRDRAPNRLASRRSLACRIPAIRSGLWPAKLAPSGR